MKTVAVNSKIEYTAPKVYSPHKLRDALSLSGKDIGVELQPNERLVINKKPLKADTVQITNAKTGETLVNVSRRGRKCGVVAGSEPMLLCKTLKLPFLGKKLAMVPKDSWEATIMKALRELAKLRI